MKVRAGKFNLGKLCVVVPCFAMGCTHEDGTPAGEPRGARELGVREADAVLGFQSAAAWTAQGRNVRANAVATGGQDALEVSIADRATLTSAAFRFAKTPNTVEFSLRAPASTTARNHRGSVEAYLSCLPREVARERVGTVALGSLTPGKSQRVRLAVPDPLQASLAGGCETLQVELVVDVGSAPGTYAVDDMKLRAQTPPIARDSTPLCGMPEPEQLFPGAHELADGYMDYQAWVTTAVMREEFPALEAALEPYKDSVLGPVTDHGTQEIVVVVDPAEYARGRLFADLQARDIALPLRIQPACHSVAEVRAAEEYMLARGRELDGPRFAGYTDPARGQYVARVDPGTPPTSLEAESFERARLGLSRLPADVIYEPTPANRALLNGLKQRFAGVIDVEWGRPGRTGRLDDGQPHFGAAGIGEGGLNFCTSGFVAIKNGFRGAVTAAHCYDFGFGPESNLWVTSGPKTYGITGVAAAYPLFDMIRIDPGGQQFTNTIHTDPGQLTRVQVGKKNPVAGLDVVCVSGMVTGAKCSISIINHNCSVAGPGGVTSGMTLGRRTGVTIVQQGDSGAPVYQQSGATGAIINGLVVARLAHDQVCFHRVGTVETQLGVTVAL